jgi:hypothetical protein
MKEEALLKEEVIPQRLFSKDKKTNSMITNQFYKNKLKN